MDRSDASYRHIDQLYPDRRAAYIEVEFNTGKDESHPYQADKVDGHI
jgi:hypothetical protein